MAFLAEEKRALDQRTRRDYDALSQKFERVVNYVASKLPKGAEEILYERGFHMEERDVMPKIGLIETYALTNKGLIELSKRDIGTGDCKLEAAIIDPVNMIMGGADEKFFESVSLTLQKVMDKYKIKLPKELM
jgi:hypothetical protein